MNNPFDLACHIFPEEFRNQVYLVGGCVRDLLLGRPSRDLDLISTLSPDEISACGFWPVISKSTALIWFRHDDATGSIETTLIPDVVELVTDLARRDFTINAIAMTLDGNIIDPLHGRADLERRLLRACGPNTFADDPLRIFRALRFEADGWEMDPGTEVLIRGQDWSPAWQHIPVERFSREMLKALQGNYPELFFQHMLKFNVGTYYLDELFKMPHIPAGPLIHHPEGDLFTHSLEVMQRVALMSNDPLTRFCAMFHDLGKLATSPTLYPKHHGHDQAGFEMAPGFCRRLRLPTHFGKALAWISKLHTTFNLWNQLRDATKLRVAGQAIKAGIVDILPTVAAADKPGGAEPQEWRRVVGIAGMTTAELGMDRERLEQLAPDKRADAILQARNLKLRSR